MVGYIDYGHRFNIQVAILQKRGVFLPGIDLNITSHIHSTTPGVIAQRAFDDLVHLHFFATNLYAGLA